MLGVFDNFPIKIHRIDRFSTKYSSRSLQEKLMRILCEANRRTFSFEEIAYPTMPKCTIILEAGIAEGRSFNYIDEEEINKVFDTLKKKTFRTLDFFFAFRYYKYNEEKKSPLKFDYYMIRTFFSKDHMEIQIFHERGPRYITPEDITTFLVQEINKSSSRIKLKIVEA
jgi:hypothetical protein